MTSVAADQEDEAALPRDDTPVQHPLLNPYVQELRAEHAELTDEEFLRHLVVFDSTHEDEDGTFERESSVRWAEPEFEAPDLFQPELPPSPRYDEAIAEFLERPDTAPALIPVRIAFDRKLWNELGTVMHQQDLALLRGEIETRQDLLEVRWNTVATIREAGEAVMAPLLDELEAEGARVTASSGYSGSASIEMPVDALAEWVDRPEVKFVSYDGFDSSDDAAGHSMVVLGEGLDGLELQDLLQAVPYYLRGYRGGLPEWMVVTENEHEVHNNHVSIYPRLIACDGTSHTSCTNAYYSSGEQHVTGTASVLLSDLTLGQDPAITDPDERRERSGVARNALALSIDKGDEERLIDLATSHAVFILNQSSTTDGADLTCRGDNTESRDWNTMYEAGIALFNSEGNNFHTDPTDCTIRSPGNAIGVFPVTPYYVNSSQNEYLPTSASLGGVSFDEGRDRTIMGLIAPSDILLRAEHDATTTPQYRSTGVNSSNCRVESAETRCDCA